MKGKKSLALSVVCAMAMSVLPMFEGTTAMNADAAFEKNAAETVADMGFGWNLGNSFDSYSGTTIGSNIGSTSSETAWGNPATTKAMIDMVKDSGVETIRVPVTWYEHMDPNTYEIDETWMNRVEEVVNYVLDADLYCIINVHHDTGEKGWLKATSDNLEQKEAMFSAIWEQVSVNFADYGDKLLFEGYNEILDGSANQWYNPSSEAVPIANELNQIFVDIVRESGGNNAKRNLICNTYCAGANSEITSGFVLPNDTVSDRLIVETHIYQPFQFTSEAYPDITTWEPTYLDQYINNVYNQFVKNGTPVIIGEFGCADKGNMDQIISWAKYYVEKCTNYGIPCIWWDNGSQYKIYNRRTLTVAEPDLLNTMLAAAKGESYVIDTTVKGDVNADGQLSDADVATLQNWLLAVPNTQLADWKAADLCEDDKLDAFDLCIMRKLLLSANNLSGDINNWNNWIDTSAGADAEMSYTSNGVKMQVNAGGEYEWNAQIFYEPITMEQGATYKISFDYKADSSQSTTFHVMQAHDNYLPYYSSELNWTTTAQHYEDTFEYTEATDKVCRIGFNLGGRGVNFPFTAEVANLSLIKVDGGSSSEATPSDPETPSETGTNLCEDAQNWTSWVYEEQGASAEVTAASDGIKAVVTNGGAEVWYVQGSYANLTLEKGATYQLEFDYKANQSASLGVNVQQNYDPYGQYYYESLDYTSSEQHFLSAFTMTENSDDNAVIVFNFGGTDVPAGFTAEISNLSLVRISDEASSDDSNDSGNETITNEINNNADMVADLRNGASSYFIPSGPWTNGGVFDCGWTSSNITFTDVMNITITDDPSGTYNYLSGEYRTTEKYGYGYYECSMMPIKADGVDTGFFMYTGPSDGDPWDEIDFEFLGYDTTKVQLNYYTNGVGGHEYMLDLGFDASEGYHTYGFDWQPDHITWYVDGVARYTATEDLPTNPGRIMVNAWPGIGVDEWIMPFEGNVPLTAKFQWITWSESK